MKTVSRDISGEIALWGLVLLTVMVPLVPFRYLVMPAGVPPAIVLAMRHLPTVGCLVLGGVWLWRRRVRIVHLLEQVPLGWPVASLLLVGLLSAVGARQPVMSMAKTIYYFATGGLLFLVLVDSVRKNHGHGLLYCLLGTGYLVASYGIVEFVAGNNLIYGFCFEPGNEMYRLLVPDPWFEQRILSTVGHPVVLGSYLTLLLPLSIAAITATNSRRVQGLLLVGTISLVAALILTFSRGAWVAAAVGVVILMVLTGGRRVLLLLILVVVFAAGILSTRAVSGVAERRLKEAYQSYVLDFGSTTRSAAYGFVSVTANRRPSTGLGTGMYSLAAYDMRLELEIPTPLGVLDTPDNMYLMWLAENGGIGLVAAVYVFVALLKTLRRWARQETSDARQILSFGFMAALVGFMVNLLTVDALYFPLVRTTFWIIVGVAVVVARPVASASEGKGSPA